jgi:protein-tyrosine phosphatase
MPLPRKSLQQPISNWQKALIRARPMKKTSLTHPLRIDSVSPGDGFGFIGMTLCPEKYDEPALTGFWHRDLAQDLDAIRTWGAAAVITLLEPEELVLLRVPSLGREVEKRGMLWIHLPIVDGSGPNQEFEQRWNSAGEDVRATLHKGSNVLVHCRGGLGRAGTIAARLLVELGTNPATAIAKVRKARPGAIETRAQERFVRSLRPS